MKTKSGMTSGSPTLAETWSFVVYGDPELADCFTAARKADFENGNNSFQGTGSTPLEAIADLIIQLGVRNNEMWFLADTLVASKLVPGLRRAR